VPSSECRIVELKYGENDLFRCDIEEERVVSHFQPPNEISEAEYHSEIAAAMSGPLDFPPLSQSVIPGDKVALALEADFADPAPIVKEVWSQLASANIQPEDVTIVQAEFPGTGTNPDPRAGLPAEIRERIVWKIHDPNDEKACRYLASATGDERIYLAEPVVNADVVVTIGQMSFDPLLGYRGTHSVFFPGLSNKEAQDRSRGQGHRELSPENDRPMRQLIDEIGWLVGTQFTVQIIPAANGGVAKVLAGSAESVLRAGKTLLRELWTCQVEERPDTVVAAIKNGPHPDGWKSLGAVLGAVRNLVANGGKVLILTNLDELPGEGVRMVRDSQEPTEAIQPLRTAASADLVTATQLAFATDWASIYLLSELPSDLVEDLFMIPVENHREAESVIEGEDHCVFLDSAQFVHGEICE
jgi:nickel-dependent lactate racemase